MAVPYSRTLIGGLPWYSVLVVAGMAVAIWLAGREEKRLGLPKDTAVDLALAAVPCGIVGARLYYVLMRWELFAEHPVSILYVWQGGLGIYGGVIGGAVGVFLYARRKKIRFASLADIIAPGLLLAQAIGRWGNYFNMEAYGTQIVDVRLQFFPLAVYIPAEQSWYAATFFYESLWNAAGFAALWMLRKKQSKPGDVFAWYLLIYGAGRFLIEQLRLDSLYIGSLRASQWLSLALCIAAALRLLHHGGWFRRETRWAIALWLLIGFGRWGLLGRNALYAAALLAGGIAGLWLVRENRKALVWMAAALLLDGAALLTAIAGWPLASIALGLHAAVCSITLVLGIWSLCLHTQ